MSGPNPGSLPNHPDPDPARPLIDVRRDDGSEHVELAALVTRLEIVARMYKDLIKRGVGTNTAENEMWRMLHERVSGPTGHRLIRASRKCEGQGQKELDVGETKEHSSSQCWREPALVRRMLNIRKRIVEKQLRLSRRKLSQQMKFVSTTRSREETEVAWLEVRKTRSEVWSVEHPKHQQKVWYLCKKAGDCTKHQMCRSLDSLWLRRGAGVVTGTSGCAQGDGEARVQ